MCIDMMWFLEIYTDHVFKRTLLNKHTGINKYKSQSPYSYCFAVKYIILVGQANILTVYRVILSFKMTDGTCTFVWHLSTDLYKLLCETSATIWSAYVKPKFHQFNVFYLFLSILECNCSNNHIVKSPMLAVRHE